MRKGWLAVSFRAVFTLLTLTSCTSFPPWTEQTVRVEGAELARRYHQEQNLRRQGPEHWGVEGILDLETPDQERRNRIDLTGSGARRIRLRAYGPFHQVALELLVAPEWMRLIDPQKRIVTEVPATAAGMEHLIGLPLHPTRLFQLVMGWADALPPGGPRFLVGTAVGVEVTSAEGERLLVDPVTGRIVERSGAAVPGRAYRAVYSWPAGGGMPERILVTLESPRSRFEFVFKRWHFPQDGPPVSLFGEEILPGFSVRRPLERLP